MHKKIKIKRDLSDGTGDSGRHVFKLPTLKEFTNCSSFHAHPSSVQSLSRAGEFSAISRGIWRDGSNKYQVAVKSPAHGQGQEHRLLLQEAAVMAQFRHPNIVTIYGVVNERDSVSKL